MKKVGIIILIIILTIIVIALSSVLFFSVKNGTGFNWSGVVNFGNSFDVRKEKNIQKEEKISIDEIQGLDLNFFSSDLNIYFTEDQEIRVVQYSHERLDADELFEVKKSGKELQISEKRKNRVYFFYFNTIAFDVYLPKQYQGVLTVEASSGSIATEENLKFESLKIATTSGEIQMNGIEAKDIKLKSVSGDIKIGRTQSDDVSIKTTSGNIMIEQLEGCLNAQTISGNVSLKSAKNNVEVKTTSGDVIIEELEGSLNAQTVSGEVKSEYFKVMGDSKVRTTSGDVKLFVQEGSNCKIETKTTSGDVKLPNGEKIIGMEPYSTFDIHTVSGDIRLTK